MWPLENSSGVQTSKRTKLLSFDMRFKPSSMGTDLNVVIMASFWGNVFAVQDDKMRSNINMGSMGCFMSYLCSFFS